MWKMIPVFVMLAVLVIFPVFIFYLLVRAIRGQVRWWGIVILLAILTCYCTTLVGIAGMIVGSNATGAVALERHYCEQFCETLKQTETLPEALARMERQVRNAREWRDVINTFFRRLSGAEDERGRTIYA